MSATTVLLVSTDPSLVESVTGLVRAITDLRLQVLAQVEEACAHLQRDGAALVVAHLPPGDADRVTPLVRAAMARHRPVPVLVVGDGHPQDNPRVRALRVRLYAISLAAGLVGRILEGARVDLLSPELERFAWQLDAIASRLQDVFERLTVGVDPQGERP
jgi:hypothetical protein